MNFKLESSHGKPDVIVLGDMILDVYEHGIVKRISPEAPVPVFNCIRKSAVLGGAGNVAANLVALGCNATVISFVGRDEPGRIAKKLLAKRKINTNCILPQPKKTTVKTRFVANNSHLLRADDEDTAALPADLLESAFAKLEMALQHADVVLLSDYAKGSLPSDFCRRAIAAATKAGKPILVDPKGSDYAKYRGATLVKPNLKELCESIGKVIDLAAQDAEEQITSAARALAGKNGFKSVLVTLGERGMIFVPTAKNESVISLPTEAREVFDVSGAGDTTIAALATALAEGRDIVNAMRFANAAAGIAVSKLGTAVVSRAELGKALSAKDKCDSGKIVTEDALTPILADLRKKGKKVGFTNGCFDCCHLGHLYSIVETKKRCDVLVVGVNSDAWIKAHKGPNRPIQDEQTRMALLAALTAVDYVIRFDSPTALPLVKAVRPDVIAKEGYDIANWPEGRYVQAHGGEAVVLPRLEGNSTSALVQKMQKRRTFRGIAKTSRDGFARKGRKNAT